MAKKVTSDQSLVSEVPPVDVAPARKAEPVQSFKPVVIPEYHVQRDAPVVIDVRREGVEVNPGVFRLQRFVHGADYKDVLNSRWIWSIGRNVHDGRVEAAIDARYYGDKNWECLFLR